MSTLKNTMVANPFKERQLTIVYLLDIYLFLIQAEIIPDIEQTPHAHKTVVLLLYLLLHSNFAPEL